MNIENLPDILVESAIDPNLESIALDFAELGLDSFLDDGLIKDIPIVGSIVKSAKCALDVRDRIFMAKVYKFLYHLGEIPWEKREKFGKKIEDDPKLKKKVGENIILILDRVDDLDKPQMIAKAFNSYLSGKINYSDFLRLSTAINKAFIGDLIAMAKQVDGSHKDKLLMERLVNSGFYKISISIDYKNSNNYIETTYGQSSLPELESEVNYVITPLGEHFVSFVVDSASSAG